MIKRHIYCNYHPINASKKLNCEFLSKIRPQFQYESFSNWKHLSENNSWIGHRLLPLYACDSILNPTVALY